MLYEMDKSLSMNHGHLAGNDPSLVNEDLVLWLLVNRVGLTEGDVERLTAILRPTRWLPF